MAKAEQVAKREPVKDFFKDVVFVLVAFFFLNSFVLASFEVPTGSMENEIMAGDFLFVNKFLYGGTTPRNIPFTNVRLPWFRVPAIRSVERGDVIAAARRRIAVLTDLPVVAPAPLGPHIREEHVLGPRLIQDPQGTTRGSTHAGLHHPINGNHQVRLFRGVKNRHHPQRPSRPPLLGRRSDELHHPIARLGVDVSHAAFKKWGIREILRRIDDTARKVVFEDGLIDLSAGGRRTNQEQSQECGQ